MKTIFLKLIFLVCLFSCNKSSKPEDNFYLPSIGFIEVRTINDFNNKFPVEFYGYEGLAHKINNEHECFKIIPCSKSTSEVYKTESATTGDIINKLGDQEIVYFEISFCNSLSKDDFETFITRHYSELNVSMEFEGDTLKLFHEKELLLQGTLGMNSKILTFMTYRVFPSSQVVR